jgi:hypothetical protein
MYILNMQTPRRKSPVDEKVPHKDDSQKAARKSTASAPSDDADKAVKKHIPTVKRTSGVLGNSNVTNLVKVPPNSKKLTDISTSWTSLPPSLAKLGKVWLKFIDTINMVLNSCFHSSLKDQALLSISKFKLAYPVVSVTGDSEVQGISTNSCC